MHDFLRLLKVDVKVKRGYQEVLITRLVAVRQAKSLSLITIRIVTAKISLIARLTLFMSRVIVLNVNAVKSYIRYDRKIFLVH